MRSANEGSRMNVSEWQNEWQSEWQSEWQRMRGQGSFLNS
jgi:hypothetical protein